MTRVKSGDVDAVDELTDAFPLRLVNQPPWRAGKFARGRAISGCTVLLSAEANVLTLCVSLYCLRRATACHISVDLAFGPIFCTRHCGVCAMCVSASCYFCCCGRAMTRG